VAGSNIVGGPQGNKVSMKPNQRINSHQNRNINQMGRVGGVIGAQGNNSQSRDQTFNDQNNGKRPKYLNFLNFSSFKYRSNE
jgi:hypothetical protein